MSDHASQTHPVPDPSCVHIFDIRVAAYWMTQGPEADRLERIADDLSDELLKRRVEP